MSDEVLPDEVTTFGQAVRYLREHKGMSLRALARKIEVSAPFLSDLEHDRRSTDKIDALAQTLGVKKEMLQALDARVPKDVLDWVKNHTGLAVLLREM